MPPRFVFLASAVDGGTDGASFGPSSSASPCPPPLVSADVIGGNLVWRCVPSTRARDLRSPHNVQVAAFPTEYCSIVIIASISIMSYQDLRKSQSTI